MQKPIFYHIDVNCAFLSWSASHRVDILGDSLDLREVPSVVGGKEEDRHGIVLAKSMPAKMMGIKTGETLMEARQKCPGLIIVSPDYPLYIAFSKKFIALLRQYAPMVHPYSIDEAFCDMTGVESIYGSPAAFAHFLRDTIRRELGFTVNIGISSNRLLAKMASEFQKPDRVHTLFPDEIRTKMWPLPVSDLFYVGHASRRKLENLGIRTIGDLAQCDPEILKAHLKSHGPLIHQFANGLDSGIDKLIYRPENKGYGNSLTTAFDVADHRTAKQFLLSLSETVGARIRADRAQITVVSVSVRDHNFRHYSHQRKLPFPTDITEKIYRTACQIFDEMWDNIPIRQLGVHTSKAVHDAGVQTTLFADNAREQKLRRLDSAIDEIRNRYGEDAVMRASFLV